MAHANARLTEFGRLLLVQRITELGWAPAVAAESLGVSRATAYKWLARYRQHGPAGLADRSSRPHRYPHALTTSQVHRVLAARRRRRQGPIDSATTWACPAPPSMGCCAATACTA
jgi:transposase